MIQTKGPLSSLAVVFHSMKEGTLLSPEGVKFFKCLNKKYVASCPESLDTFLPAAKQKGMVFFTPKKWRKAKYLLEVAGLAFGI